MDRETRVTVLFWIAVMALGVSLTARRALRFEEAAEADSSIRDPPAPAGSAWSSEPAKAAPSTSGIAGEEPGADRTSPLAALDGQLRTENEPGRSGYFHFPARSLSRPLPLVVALHGQGGDGRDLVAAFRTLSDSFGFAVLAPSSRYDRKMATYAWEPGSEPNEITPDFRHVQACVEEVLGRSDVAVNRDRVLIAGFSSGGSTAPYVATNTGPYHAFAVLHGGVFPRGLGTRMVRGFLSTGTTDPARTPAHVKGHFEALRARGFDVVYKEYPGGHQLSNDELTDLVEWWLHGA